jgi:hypothetical protein
MTNLGRQVAKQRGFEYASTQAAGLADKLVYFNSAEYNGHQFLSEDAALAGYKRQGMDYNPNTDIIETGIAALVEQDIHHMAVQAETSLLSLLVRNVAARAVAKNLMEARDLLKLSRSSSDTQIAWSSQAREWLFQSLTGLNVKLQRSSLPSKTEELRLLLANSADVPPNSFDYTFPTATVRAEQSEPLEFASSSELQQSYIETTEAAEDSFSALPMKIKRVGSLECFFEDEGYETNKDLVNMAEIRVDLFVQELCAILFWTSSAINAQRIRHDISKWSQSISLPRSLQQHNEPDNSIVTSNSQTDTESISALTTSSKISIINENSDAPVPPNHINFDTSQDSLLGKFRIATKAWQASSNSMKQATARLMDEGTTLGRLEGKMSAKTQSDLYAQVDAFLEEQAFLSSNRQTSELDFLFQTSTGDEPYEEAVERMQKEFGDWYDDEYVWSPEHSTSASFQSIPFQDYGDDENEEPIEYALERIDREWGQTD